MPNNPLVSVIVPIFNAAPYLRPCLDSIIGQTHTNLEILLIDDGSTDASAAICDEYAAADARITVIHKDNGGVSSARNAGLDLAAGEYVQFVDSDDWIAPDMTERLTALAEKNNADAALCGWCEVSEADGRQQTFRNPFFEARGSVVSLDEKTLAAYYFTALRANKLESMCVQITRLSLLKEAALRFHDMVEVGHEDMLFAFCLYAVLRRVAFLDEALYFYRIRANSLTTGTHTAQEAKIHAILRGMRIFASFLEAQGAAAVMKKVVPTAVFLQTYVEYRVGCFSNDPALWALAEETTRALHRDRVLRRDYWRAFWGRGLARLCAGDPAAIRIKARLLALAYACGGPRYFLRLQLHLPRERIVPPGEEVK